MHPRIPILASVLLLGLAVSAAPFGGAQEPHLHLDALADFPGHDDVLAAIAKHDGHSWMTIHLLGESGKGRVIQAVEITDPESPVPREERVVTFLFTQQHGNEPAGTPAALRLLEAIAAGEPIAKTLANQVLVLLPMANPDGASAGTRGNADGVDINRDHMALSTPEARILHRVLNEWDVHVAMDHHEYGGTGAGNPVPVRVYDFDLTLMHPNHGNVRATTFDAARDLMYEGIWPAAEAAGFTVGEYGLVTANGVPVQQIAGGPDPGIMRNHLGLHNVAGLLVESRVDNHPNPFHTSERRAEIHYAVMEATLEYASQNAARFIEAKRASERAAVESPAMHYSEGERHGGFADAYRVTEDLNELFAHHGLPPLHATEAGFVHNMRHELEGHAAALLHPESSRKVAAASATAPVLLPSEDLDTLAEDAARVIPGAGFALGLAGLVGAALVAARVRRA